MQNAVHFDIQRLHGSWGPEGQLVATFQTEFEPRVALFEDLLIYSACIEVSS